MQINKEQIVDRAKEIANTKISEEAKSQLYLDRKTKGVLDAVQEKVVSRKLLVFLTATSLFVWSGLDPDVWGMIAMCYIGGQSAIDFAKIWKG
tara:strand:+ start:229 stop:507 length:279 start_codon:yes stop_codon:yes gene_type:complete